MDHEETASGLDARMTRRRALRIGFAAVALPLLAACGPQAGPSPTAAPSKPADSKPAEAAKPADAKPAEVAKPAQQAPAAPAAPAAPDGHFNGGPDAADPSAPSSCRLPSAAGSRTESASR